ncbi:MAG: Ferredoxin reductase [uncultured Chloroflexi bacterium]|uniref:Ferredoxin reductase n=1 Tax=uncultured Chloroflexota bacterium TaxID=166587 RepID=A0A6J4I4P7_9CHLR|nr:MAG: Ferredoxin reductase [uncultured Chloroflexota bacterium]
MALMQAAPTLNPAVDPGGVDGAPDAGKFVSVCTVEELQERGVITPVGLGQSVALFWHDGRPYAVDNRCPHMGFPLSKGFCKDAILTCYWHYARFDLRTGGAFDTWADDVRTFPVRTHDGRVWINLAAARTSEEERSHWTGRLQEALDQNIPLVQAKSILALLDVPRAWRRTCSPLAHPRSVKRRTRPSSPSRGGRRPTPLPGAPPPRPTTSRAACTAVKRSTTTRRNPLDGARRRGLGRIRDRFHDAFQCGRNTRG